MLHCLPRPEDVRSITEDLRDSQGPRLEAIALGFEVIGLFGLETIALSLEANALRLGAIALRLEPTALRMEVIALRLEAIALRLEAIGLSMEVTALRMEAIALRLEAIALRLEAIGLSMEVTALRLEAIGLRLEATALRSKAQAKRTFLFILMPFVTTSLLLLLVWHLLLVAWHLLLLASCFCCLDTARVDVWQTSAQLCANGPVCICESGQDSSGLTTVGFPR